MLFRLENTHIFAILYRKLFASARPNWVYAVVFADAKAAMAGNDARRNTPKLPRTAAQAAGLTGGTDEDRRAVADNEGGAAGEPQLLLVGLL